eukprot:6984673-Prymnesium_polylepis.2
MADADYWDDHEAEGRKLQERARQLGNVDAIEHIERQIESNRSWQLWSIQDRLIAAQESLERGDSSE